MILTSFTKKIFGTRNERVLKKLRHSVVKINALEGEYEALTDQQLLEKKEEFKARYQAGESLDDLLVEAFSAVREASKRTLGMRHFDVQLIGGMVLHKGKVAEMRTGEGKTLMSTLPAYLNVLSGNSVHMVTVNDYLAERDANWMRPIYDALGVTLGINLPHMGPQEKQEAYAADITYGTNGEFGFDYLRDNMVYERADQVQSTLSFAIIDEVDSILIDEARTPLIISGAAEQTETYYLQLNSIIPHLEKQEMAPGQKEEEVAEGDKRDFTVDEKSKQVHLTEKGHEKVEHLLVEAKLMSENESLYDYKNITLMHFVYAALRAHMLYQKDVDYVVKDNEVVLVDEHTGRLMTGRRWSDGLHQAVEAKEGAKIQMENQTMAAITFQNFFRLYGKLSGMTGTADTEAFELNKIYGLEVVVIPTNLPMRRDDRQDLVYLSELAKYNAVVEKIKAIHATKQPVLVGTASIEASEYVSSLLDKEKIPHSVLNAKQHEKEAKTIAQAGRLEGVTIATNMAGRGTDIVLGGNLEVMLEDEPDLTDDQRAVRKEAWQKEHDDVITLGGLFVLATERHESRRIDNQLRGRSGRQGDPGVSVFFLSMEDNLMRIFASDRVKSVVQRLGFQEDDVIESKLLTGAIEKAQRRVEGHHYDARKSLLEYDDVANDQRKVVYEERNKLLIHTDLTKTVKGLQRDAIDYLFSMHVAAGSTEESWDVPGLSTQLHEDFHLTFSLVDWLEEQDVSNRDAMKQVALEMVMEQYEDKVRDVEPEQRHYFERAILLQTMDQQWKGHLAAMDHLRKSIHLRSYAQKNPALEYKRESFQMFENMLEVIGYEVVSLLARVSFEPEPELQAPISSITYTHEDGSALPQQEEAEGTSATMYRRDAEKIGRNVACPCGSAKKYKHCHGKV